MRRPRYKLQVSTFPFLAVLLCAMGSLLMLLFIMDRRSKIAAQHLSEEALQARKQRTQEEEAALQAEWEQAKQKLHKALLLQHGDLAAQGQVLQIDLSDANKKLQLLQAQHQDLDAQAKAEAAKIADIQIQIAGRRAGLVEADKKETMSKKELIAAVAELAELELAFQQLLAVKEREKQVHSLVPYHGKRGDTRTPIYVECLRDGVVFHPDDKTLQRYEFTPGSVRMEIERRSGPLVVLKAADAKLPAEEKKGAYVLFLVRPAGITSFYRAQSALKGYRIDFGYELIDADWELDFGGPRLAKNGPASAPSTRTQMPKDDRPIIEVPLPIFPGGRQGNGGDSFGPPSGVAVAPGPLTSPPGGGTGGMPGAGVGIGSMGTPGNGNSNGNAGKDPVGIGPPAAIAVGPGPASKGPAFVPFNKIQPPMAVASTGATLGDPSIGRPNPTGGSSKPMEGVGQNPQPGALPRTNGAAPGATTDAKAQPNVPGSPAQSPADPGNSGAPATLPRTNVAPPGAPTDAKNQPGGPGSPGQSPGGSGEAGPPSALPAAFAGSTKKPAPPPLSKLVGNKDFIIYIDCYDDHINIFPGGMTFRWTAATAHAVDQAFAQAVAKLIERRQASVRPGEPPYRPLICFRVSPDGRPIMLRVYPLLESLHVPMTRENVVE